MLIFAPAAAPLDNLNPNKIPKALSLSNSALSRNSDTGEIEARYYSLSSTYKMAKNMLLVGAQGDGVPAQPWSSRGPTTDNRLKPDFVAYVRNGTSGAAAITSGFSLLLREAYTTITGRKVLTVNDWNRRVSIAMLKDGLYVAILLREGERLGTCSFIVHH